MILLKVYGGLLLVMFTIAFLQAACEATLLTLKDKNYD